MIPSAAPVVLDTCVISNFAIINRMDLLQTAFPSAVVMLEVVNEGSMPFWLKQRIQAALGAGWLEQRELQPGQWGLYMEYTEDKLLEPGESASLAWLHSEGSGTIVSDEFAVMREADRAGFDVVTSLSLLYHHYKVGTVTEQQADQYMTFMRQGNRARFPKYLQNFTDVIADFEKPAPTLR